MYDMEKFVMLCYFDIYGCCCSLYHKIVIWFFQNKAWNNVAWAGMAHHVTLIPMYVVIPLITSS